MNQSVPAIGMLFGCVLATIARTETANEQPTVISIPLKSIWAYEMPGTRDVRRLEPTVYGDEARSRSSEENSRRVRNSQIQQIRQTLQPPDMKSEGPVKSASPKTCIAVSGTGEKALREACLILLGQQPRRETFKSQDEVSVVFLSNQCGRYVQLQEVKRIGNTIEVRYRFVPHLTKELTEHFALIPLGKLPVGKFHIQIIQLPMDKEFATWNVGEVPATDAGKIVCKSSSFTVGD